MAPTLGGDLTLLATAGPMNGSCVGHGRTGHTCSNPKEGHHPTATHANIMGDSAANKDWTPNKTA
jgi:hypothetical protein